MTFDFHSASKSLILSDSEYYLFLLEKIRRAKKSIDAAIFIIDLRRVYDTNKLIKNLLDEIVYAQWRGIDIRIIVGHSEHTPEIDISDRVAHEYLKRNGINVKFSNPPDDYSLHSKYVIIDNSLVINGSHNWESFAITSNKEDSIAIYSPDLAFKFKQEFDELWTYGLEAIE